MTCADDWWDAQRPDYVADNDPDDEPPEPYGPPVTDLPDIATYRAA